MVSASAAVYDRSMVRCRVSDMGTAYFIFRQVGWRRFYGFCGSDGSTGASSTGSMVRRVPEPDGYSRRWLAGVAWSPLGRGSEPVEPLEPVEPAPVEPSEPPNP